MIGFNDQDKERTEKIIAKIVKNFSPEGRENFLNSYADYILDLDDFDDLTIETDQYTFNLANEKVPKPAVDKSFDGKLSFLEQITTGKIIFN